MKITRSLTVNKINVICYDPENKCEFVQEVCLIGNLTDQQRDQKKKFRHCYLLGKNIRRNKIIRDGRRSVFKKRNRYQRKGELNHDKEL